MSCTCACEWSWDLRNFGMETSTSLALEAVGIRSNVCITCLTQSNWVCEVPVLVVPIHRPAKHTTVSQPRFGHNIINIGHSFVCYTKHLCPHWRPKTFPMAQGNMQTPDLASVEIFEVVCRAFCQANLNTNDLQERVFDCTLPWLWPLRSGAKNSGLSAPLPPKTRGWEPLHHSLRWGTLALDVRAWLPQSWKRSSLVCDPA